MRRRRLLAAAGVAVGLVAALAILVLVVANSDWGRERARSTLLRSAAAAVHGELTIGRVEGNLLGRFRLLDVHIIDEQGRPFVDADTVYLRVSIPPLLRRRIQLRDVHIARLELIVDKPPGEDWNFARILPTNPDPTRPPSQRRWGDWISLHDVKVTDAHIMVRTEWDTSDDLDAPQRQEALERALAPDARENVVQVPGGYQNVMDFRDLNTVVSRMLLAHPDSAAMVIEVASLSGVLEPFRPPAAVVNDMSGLFRLVNDSLYMTGIEATLPHSRFTGEAIYALESGELLLHMEGAPAGLADLRWLRPGLPEEGGGPMKIEVRMRSLATRAVITDADVRVGDARMSGRIDVTVGDTLRIQDTDVRFENLGTRLVAGVFPYLRIPRHGELTGHLILAGTPSALDVDGDVVFEDEMGSGTSHVFAEGRIGVDGSVRFSDLSLRFAPLQAELLHALGPGTQPLRGTVEGTARLTGVFGDLQLDSDLTLRDPESGVSRVVARGGVEIGDRLVFTDLALRFDPLQAALLERFQPASPFLGSVVGTARLSGVWTGRLQLDSDLTFRDPRGGPSRVRATGGVETGSDFRLVNMRVRMDPLHLNVIREQVPDLPSGATMVGEVLLNGVPSRLLNVDGDVAIHDPVSGESRVGARGGVIFAPAGLRFQRLALQLHPLRLGLLPRVGWPDAPVGGTLEGSAVLDGDPKGRLAFDADVVHVEAGERTRVVGSGVLGAGAEGTVALDLGLDSISLAAVGRLFPEAGLRGMASGTFRVSGSKSALDIRADLTLPGGGTLSGQGTVDVASEMPGYDLSLVLSGVDLAAISTRAPATTDLTGTVFAQGRGFEPATMDARVVADLQGIRVNDLSADRVHLNAQVGHGLAQVDSSVVQLRTAEAYLDGSFGLVAGRDGVLTYEVRVDSLHALAPWVPGADTAVVAPRPAVRRAVVEQARAERERVLRAAQVESIATGNPIPSAIAIDTLAAEPAGIPSDSLAGSARASGEIRGNLERFDVVGSADLERVVYQGSYVGAGHVTYELLGVGSLGKDVRVAADLQTVLARGFAYDSVNVQARYAGDRFGVGALDFVAYQDAFTDVDATVRFTLAEQLKELRLEEIRIRMDSVTWHNTQVGSVRWGGQGTEIRSMELVSDAGGRLFMDGRLPVDGPADLQVVAENVELAHVEALLQEDLDASGLIQLDARVTGTRSAPTIVGSGGLTGGTIGGTSLQNVRGSFSYAGQELTGRVEVLDQGRLLAKADVRIPMNLALERIAGPRILHAPLFVDVQADSLPIGALSAFSRGQIQQVGGVARGAFTVRGTFDDPVFEGAIDLVGASLFAAPLGVTLSDIGVRLTLAGNQLTLDSLVAWSGGEVRVTGGVDLSNLREPTFELTLLAQDARILDNDQGKLTVDATLDVRGPFDAVAVTGYVHAERGVLYIPELSELGATSIVALDEPATFERVDTLLAARRDLLLERNPLLERLNVDVLVSADRDVWLRSLEANVEIYTPPEMGPMRVQLNGGERRLLLDGTINTDRGEYEFMSRGFQLTRGAVTFLGDPEMNAILQVVAEHEVRIPGRQAFAIRVLLGGTLREPTITMESTAQPPISQTDLLTYVAFGRNAGSVLPVHGSALSGSGGADDDLVGNAASLATQQLATAAVGTVINDLEGDVARSLGVDVFRITPADFPSELFSSAFADVLRNAEIEIGAYLTPRFFASAQAPATFKRPGARLEYVTPRGFRWITTWQPRYLPSEPSLAVPVPLTTNAFGLLFRREWRF